MYWQETPSSYRVFHDLLSNIQYFPTGGGQTGTIRVKAGTNNPPTTVKDTSVANSTNVGGHLVYQTINVCTVVTNLTPGVVNYVKITGQLSAAEEGNNLISQGFVVGVF